MENRFKIGFIKGMSYGPSLRQQESALLNAGVLKDNIFRAPDDTALDAVKACREDNVFVIAFERLLGVHTAAVFKWLDSRNADLYCTDSDTLYPGSNGKTFCKFLENKHKDQTLPARRAQKRRDKKLTKEQLDEAERMIYQGKKMHEVAKHFKVAANYFPRKGITVTSVREKYDS